jgi:spermidine synthase
MVATRNQQAQRMVREVFGNGPGSSLELALVENNMMDVLAWLTCDDQQFKELEYTDASNNNNIKILKYGDYHKIRILRAMVFYKRANGAGDDYDATDATQDEF